MLEPCRQNNTTKPSRLYRTTAAGRRPPSGAPTAPGPQAGDASTATQQPRSLVAGSDRSAWQCVAGEQVPPGECPRGNDEQPTGTTAGDYRPDSGKADPAPVKQVAVELPQQPGCQQRQPD